MIYDCFTYCGEIDLLEIRLQELDSIVDHFVIVEADHTFQGEWRGSFNLNNERGRLFQWNKKIQHVRVSEELPSDPWAAEYYVRNQIVRGLTRATPEDLVIISDVDEIPRSSILRNLNPVPGDRLLLELREFYYYLNYEVPQRINWIKPVVMRAQELLDHTTTPQAARLTGENPKHDRIPDAGWHFSCMGGAEALRLKLQSFAHSDLNTPEKTDLEFLQKCISSGEDILGRFTCKQVEIDESFPLLIQMEQTRNLAHLIHRER